MRRKFQGLAQITQHISRLKFYVRTLRSIKLIQLSLTGSSLLISQHRGGIQLLERREVVDGIVEILNTTISHSPEQ